MFRPQACRSRRSSGRFESAARIQFDRQELMLQRFARTVLRALGWLVEFAEPPGPRGIIIVYPHTSNWDFVVGLLAKWAIGLPLRFVGKESLFRGLSGITLGRLMRLWGGRPIDRHRASGAVEQLARLMRSEAWFWLALSPEGTRRFQDHIRSGFYHLALAEQVPVGLAFIDWERKALGVTRYVHLSGDVTADLELLRRYYADKRGLRPAQAGTIAFRRPAAGDDPG
jgi:1-acyl-sn-glycerol-3-phosphate acyltransferase